MNKSCYYTSARGVVSTELDGETVLMHVARGQYYSLNEVGSLLWASLQEKQHSLSELCQIITGEFEIDEETCRKDIIKLLMHMESVGVIEQVS